MVPYILKLAVGAEIESETKKEHKSTLTQTQPMTPSHKTSLITISFGRLTVKKPINFQAITSILDSLY